MKFTLFTSRPNREKPTSSEFSRFFRNASSGEKKRVFMDVARKASADQMKILQG